MIDPSKASSVCAALVLAALTLAPRPARALQPVTEFLQHAQSWNPQNAAAQATALQRDAEVSVATGGLLPNFTATGTYQRNQYEIDTSALIPSGLAPAGETIPNSVITPLNQLDGYLTLNVPIINVASWDKRANSKAILAGSEADRANVDLTIQKNVLRDYYTLLGDEAVLDAATKNLEVAAHNLQVARDKKASGTASELDVQRALADQAKAEQSRTNANLQVVNTRRDLYSLTGLEAQPASTFPEDDLHDEKPLEAWTGKTNDLPVVRSAVASRESAEEAAGQAKAAWLPTVNGVATEHFTNATAFLGGHSAVYLLQLTASWKLDLTLGPEVKAQNAAAAAARANEDRIRINAEDAVFRDWQQIHADIESSRSARAQVAATKLAASLADDRYKNGVATQLDLLQARQDAFAADVARIQADADLEYARMALRIDAGQLASLSGAP